jgi:hypothetical protein
MNVEQIKNLPGAHLIIEGQPISAICDQHQIYPALFYGWQNNLLWEWSGGLLPLDALSQNWLSTHKVVQLEARLKRNDEVIAAATEEQVQTKTTWVRLK